MSRLCITTDNVLESNIIARTGRGEEVLFTVDDVTTNIFENELKGQDLKDFLIQLHIDLNHIGYKRLAQFYRKYTNKPLLDEEARVVTQQYRTCELFRKEYKNVLPSSATQTKNFMDQVHVDLFEFTHHITKEKSVILVAIDKATKWVWAQKVSSKLRFSN